MSNMFSNCSSLESLPDISKWNTSNANNMSYMFSNCSSLKLLPDISKWNTNNVNNMSDMFYFCESLKSIPDISKWNTNNVNNISFMFSNCSSLESLPNISKWNTNNVNNMSFIFYYCSSLKSLPDISKWNTSNVYNISNMLSNCSSLKSLPDISKWNINNISNMSGIIEDEFIPVEIIFIFKYNYNQSIFDIIKSKIKPKEFDKIDKKYKQKNFINNRACRNIKSFTENFPNFVIFEEKNDIDIYELQKRLKIPEKLQFYFNLIKEYLIANKKISSSLEIEEINNKIYDYVMSKIYYKIFPKTNLKDDKIFNKCFILSWTEPKHFIPGKINFLFDSFLPGIINYFKLIDKEKSPRKMLLYVKEIFILISKIVKFNEGDENTRVDDKISILNYAFIKAQPLRFYSNLELMELYIGDMKSKEGNQLDQLNDLCYFIIHLNYNNLYGVTKEEFIKKCNFAALGRES